LDLGTWKSGKLWGPDRCGHGANWRTILAMRGIKQCQMWHSGEDSVCFREDVQIISGLLMLWNQFLSTWNTWHILCPLDLRAVWNLNRCHNLDGHTSLGSANCCRSKKRLRI
jgi:hypothetical protein